MPKRSTRDFTSASGSKTAAATSRPPTTTRSGSTRRRLRSPSRLRLLYVAATRARDHLVIPDIQGKSGPGFLLESLQPQLPSDEGHRIVADDVWLLDADELELEAAESVKSRKVPSSEVKTAQKQRGAWLEEHADLLRTPERSSS